MKSFSVNIGSVIENKEKIIGIEIINNPLLNTFNIYISNTDGILKLNINKFLANEDFPIFYENLRFYKDVILHAMISRNNANYKFGLKDEKNDENIYLKNEEKNNNIYMERIINGKFEGNNLKILSKVYVNDNKDQKLNYFHRIKTFEILDTTLDFIDTGNRKYLIDLVKNYPVVPSNIIDIVDFLNKNYNLNKKLIHILEKLRFNSKDENIFVFILKNKNREESKFLVIFFDENEKKIKFYYDETIKDLTLLKEENKINRLISFNIIQLEENKFIFNINNKIYEALFDKKTLLFNSKLLYEEENYTDKILDIYVFNVDSKLGDKNSEFTDKITYQVYFLSCLKHKTEIGNDNTNFDKENKNYNEIESLIEEKSWSSAIFGILNFSFIRINKSKRIVKILLPENEHKNNFENEIISAITNELENKTLLTIDINLYKYDKFKNFLGFQKINKENVFNYIKYLDILPLIREIIKVYRDKAYIKDNIIYYPNIINYKGNSKEDTNKNKFEFIKCKKNNKELKIFLENWIEFNEKNQKYIYFGGDYKKFYLILLKTNSLQILELKNL